MSGGQRHHHDEDERAEPLGWTQIRERSSFSLEEEQCVCANALGVFEIMKNLESQIS
jgi:hypothetical protein